GLHVLAVERGLAQAQDLPVGAVALGALEQRLVDVGDVLDVFDLEPLVPPVAVHQVEGDHRGGVAQMRRVIGGDAAHVHGGALSVARHRLPHFAGGGVVQAQCGAVAGQGRYVGCGPRFHSGDRSSPEAASASLRPQALISPVPTMRMMIAPNAKRYQTNSMKLWVVTNFISQATAM